MNLLQVLSFLDDIDSTWSCDEGSTLVSVLGVAKLVVRVLQILVPIALIVWGTIDIGKAVIAGDEKKMKEAQKPFVRRIIAAVIVFLIPWLVGLILNLVGGTEWKNCWANADATLNGVQRDDPMSVD